MQRVTVARVVVRQQSGFSSQVHGSGGERADRWVFSQRGGGFPERHREAEAEAGTGWEKWKRPASLLQTLTTPLYCTPKSNYVTMNEDPNSYKLSTFWDNPSIFMRNFPKTTNVKPHGGPRGKASKLVTRQQVLTLNNYTVYLTIAYCGCFHFKLDKSTHQRSRCGGWTNAPKCWRRLQFRGFLGLEQNRTVSWDWKWPVLVYITMIIMLVCLCKGDNTNTFKLYLFFLPLEINLTLKSHSAITEESLLCALNFMGIKFL